MPVKALLKLKNDFAVSSPAFRHAVRAALAITAAIAAAKSLDLSHAVWIPISVIVVMRPSLGGSLQISWKRFAGTVIGAVAGVLLIYLRLSPVAVFLLVSLLSFFIFYFKTKNFIVFTAILTLSVVLVLGTVFSHTWQGGMERILDTFLGIGFGLGASVLVWPNFARKQLRKEMAALIRAQHTHFRQLRDAYFSDVKDTGPLLTGRLNAARNLEACTEKFRDAAIEPGLRASQRQELLNLTAVFTRIHAILTALSSIVNKSAGAFPGPARRRFEELMDACETEFSLLKNYAENDIRPVRETEFPTTFSSFMAFLGQMRSRGEFENLSLDRRNNSSAFISQINRLGLELIRAGNSIEALRKK